MNFAKRGILSGGIMEAELNNIRQQSEKCDDHPEARIDVAFDAKHRVFVCRCEDCGNILDEFNE